MTALRGLVRPGNSGGPMVNPHGQVVATVFAALTDAGRGPAGSRSRTALVRGAAGARASAPTGTRSSSGRCAGASRGVQQHALVRGRRSATRPLPQAGSCVAGRLRRSAPDVLGHLRTTSSPSAPKSCG